MPPTPSHAAGPEVIDPVPAGPDAVVVFQVGPWRMGLPIEVIVEALPAARIGRLPDAPEGVAGYLDVRGDALPVIDLRVVLGSATEPLRPSHHFLVCRATDRRVVLWIDRVLRLDGSLRSAGRDFPADDRSRHIEAFARSDDGIVLIQDLGVLLRPAHAQALRRALGSLAGNGEGA